MKRNSRVRLIRLLPLLLACIFVFTGCTATSKKCYTCIFWPIPEEVHNGHPPGRFVQAQGFSFDPSLERDNTLD